MVSEDVHERYKDECDLHGMKLISATETALEMHLRIMKTSRLRMNRESKAFRNAPNPVIAEAVSAFKSLNGKKVKK
jgi:hypothetical protein